MKFRPIFKSRKARASPRAAKFVALPCCTVLFCGGTVQSCTVLLCAAVVLWCSDSRSVRWGNPEHSVSLSDTPVSTHDKQHTYTRTHTNAHTSVSAKPSLAADSSLTLPPPRKAANILAASFSFVLGKWQVGGGLCVRVCVCLPC